MAVSTVSTVCSSEDVCGSLSFSAALGLTIIFSALMVVHTGQAIYYGKPWIYHFRTSTIWALLYPLWASTAWTFLSFLNLTASYFDPHPLLLLFSRNFLLISPLWFTTYLHLLLPHLTNHFLPPRTLCSVRAPVLRLLGLLFTLPVAGLQVVGVLSGVESHGRGRVLFAAGVMLQGVGILIFICMLYVLDREVRGLENGGVLDGRKKGWRRGVWTGYASAVLVLIILLSRLIRLFAPHIMRSKHLIYILEVIPLLLATLSWNVLHPGRILVGEEKMESLWGEEFRYTRGVGVDTVEEDGIVIGIGMGIATGIWIEIGGEERTELSTSDETK
ncbi:RTA1 domain-containing protein [Rutstroemia sp. NJR-2017a WRK4]|nr:RTA1 domain-containing protein [Rutstroemia sp. NJR-2017a WRK4]